VGAFTFVPTRNFCDPHPRRYRIESREATQIFNHTTIINNFGVDSHSQNFINHGIDPERITAVTRTEIHPITIHDTTGPAARGEQLGRDGRTLFVDRPHFNDNPSPAMDRGVPPRTSPVARPGIGSPHQPPNNYGNVNALPQQHYQPTAPVQTPTPSTHPSSSANYYVPPTPTRPPANYNLDNSIDNRRYPSPRQQQIPGSVSGNNENRGSVPTAVPSSPPTGESPQHNYVAPPNEPSVNQPRANSPPPASGGQSHGAPTAPPQRSGGNKNQKGQE
jgi:hypothetical protein